MWRGLTAADGGSLCSSRDARRDCESIDGSAFYTTVRSWGSTGPRTNSKDDVSLGPKGFYDSRTNTFYSDPGGRPPPR